MALPGETLKLGAPRTCPTCKTKVKPEVLRSAAGFYIGTQCKCGPYTRESYYYESRDMAEHALKTNTVKYRTSEYTPDYLQKVRK